MATRAGAKRDRGREPLRFTAEQVWAMGDRGIIPQTAALELWDGILYQTAKSELHNAIVGEVAELFRVFTPVNFHVREEKTVAFGGHDLPVPDVAICRGGLGDYLPVFPDLSHLALVVEVDHGTRRADCGPKLRRYAEAGIPVYWVVDATARHIRVHWSPRAGRGRALYASRRFYSQGESVPIVVDGREVARIPVDSVFPPPKSECPS